MQNSATALRRQRTIWWVDGLQCKFVADLPVNLPAGLASASALLLLLMTCVANAQLMAFKELGVKVEHIVAYTNEQVSHILHK